MNKPKRMKPYQTWQLVRRDNGEPALSAENRNTKKSAMRMWMNPKLHRIARVEIREVKK